MALVLRRPRAWRNRLPCAFSQSVDNLPGKVTRPSANSIRVDPANPEKVFVLESIDELALGRVRERVFARRTWIKQQSNHAR